MSHDRGRFYQGVARMIRASDPHTVMCLCRGVPRSQLGSGECDLDGCVTRYLDREPAARGIEEEGDHVERYTPFSA